MEKFVVDTLEICIKRGNKITLFSSKILSKEECQEILKNLNKISGKHLKMSDRLAYLLNYYFEKKKLEFISAEGGNNLSLYNAFLYNDDDYESGDSDPNSWWHGFLVFRKIKK